MMPNSAACWFFDADLHVVKFLSHIFLFQALGRKAYAVKHAGFFQDWIFALLWHLGYHHLCCSDAQRPSRLGPCCTACWVNAGWQPLPREPAAWFTGFRWPLPPAALDHRLPDQSLPGVDKEGMIQVRQPPPVNIHITVYVLHITPHV